MVQSKKTRKTAFMLIKVNDTNLYYEVHGNGTPIILVHGNSESHKIFDVLIGELKNNHTVYAIDSRNHGKSDRTKSVSYDLMADDIIGFIEKLQIDKPIIYGFSDGGIIGLLIAIKRPRLLSKLIISGANLNPDGISKSMTTIIKLGYFFSRSKNLKMMLNEPNISADDLEKIKIPTLILAGERDVIKEKHTKLIASSIANSTLIIVPNETHSSYIIHSKKLYDLIHEFLNI